MDYFTLAEDLEDIESANAKRLKSRLFPVLISVTVLAFFLLLRGIEVITLEYNKGYFVEKHEVSKKIKEIYAEGTRIREQTKNSVIDNNRETYNRDLGISVGISFSNSQKKDDIYSANEKSFLEKTIQEKISGDDILKENFSAVEVTVPKLDMEGLYWFPLIKKGKIEYQAVIENRYYQDTYSAEFSGEIDLEVYGFCTNASLEKEIAKEIGEVIARSIKDDYKK